MEATKETKFVTGSLGDEDDARTLNTRIAIPHKMMKDNRLSIIMCCNNTHQGAPHTRTLTEFAKKCAVHATPGQSLRFGPR